MCNTGFDGKVPLDFQKVQQRDDPTNQNLSFSSSEQCSQRIRESYEKDPGIMTPLSLLIPLQKPSTSKYSVLAKIPKTYWLPVYNLTNSISKCRYYYTNVGSCETVRSTVANWQDRQASKTTHFATHITYYTLNILHTTHTTHYTLHTKH